MCQKEYRNDKFCIKGVECNIKKVSFTQKENEFSFQI